MRLVTRRRRIRNCGLFVCDVTRDTILLFYVATTMLDPATGVPNWSPDTQC